MIGAVAACDRHTGWDVIGTAPTARAARQLRDAAGVDADTMHALLLHLVRNGGPSARTVLVFDEAAMAPTRLTARLFELAEAAGAKVIAVGDPGQLGSVEAGGWLAAVTAAQPQPNLGTAIRQHDPAERDALQALRAGDPDPYIDHQQEQISIHEHETDAIHTLVGQWRGARSRHGASGAVMIARDNYTRELANRAARS
jgi:ATP-dependent exoDNAse (exonuclease V) alpha subunit